VSRARTRRTVRALEPARCVQHNLRRTGPQGWQAIADIDAPHQKERCTAASFLKKGLFPDVSGAPGWSELEDAMGQDSRTMLLSESEMSNHKGAA
jgi:hypothetical protein